MLRLFAKSVLIRAPILLPIPQHIRGPSLDHALQRTVRSQLPSQSPKKVKQVTHRPSDMPLQPFLTFLMHRMALSNLTQTIPHQKLVIPRREYRCRYIDQDGDPAVVHVAECFAAEEDGGHDSRSKVTSEVRRDGDVGEAPDHGSVCETDGEGSAGGRDKGVRRIETGPNYNADIGIDEEFGQEEVAEVSGRRSV